MLAFLAGIGGGAFSGFMPSTSYFFPRWMQGTALGLQAGIGNFGVSLVQLLTPWLIGFGLVGFLGGSQQMKVPGKPDVTVWFQNAAFFYVPFIIVGAIIAWMLLKSVPVKANIRQQFDIFGNQDTWWMTLLYIMTFGTFSGLSAQFGLLMTNLYGSGNAAIVKGTGATAQLLFLFAGIGNASTFKQMPMIFERRQAGGVIGWTGAIAAFGPFLFGVGLTLMPASTFYAIGVAWAVLCVALTWWRYARPGAPKPS